MKPISWTFAVLFGGAALAADLRLATMASAGGRSISGAIANDAVLTDLSGYTTGFNQTLLSRSGYVGQLTDVVRLQVDASPDALLDE